MRRLIGPIVGLLTAVTAANAQNMIVHELPDAGAGRVDMGSVEAQLDAAGWFGVERNFMRALLTDLAAANVTGTLRPGTGIALKFPVKRDKTTPAMATEVHQYEFTFSYTPTNQIVRGGVQYRDPTGRWVTPVSELYGSAGSLVFSGGITASGATAVDWYFFAHDTDADGTKPPPSLRYSAGVKRVDQPITPEPPSGGWTATGTGPKTITIPDSVLRFRVRGTYSGRGQNFVVWCGNHRDTDDRGGLLVNEIVGTNYASDDWVWFTVRNERSYNGRGRPCSILTMEHSEGVRWEMEQLTNRP